MLLAKAGPRDIAGCKPAESRGVSSNQRLSSYLLPVKKEDRDSWRDELSSNEQRWLKDLRREESTERPIDHCADENSACRSVSLPRFNSQRKIVNLCRVPPPTRFISFLALPPPDCGDRPQRQESRVRE